MIEGLNKVINKVNRKINHNGVVQVDLPRLTKRRLVLSSKTNCLSGSGLIVLGMVTKTKWPLILGGIAIASGLLMKTESYKLSD